MEGYIKLYRQIVSNWMWSDRPFAKGQAWIDLMMQANHKDAKFLLGNEVEEASRGQLITSEKKLMERWGWSKTKVRAFLSLLEREQMIVKKTDQKKTVLTLCNYSVFQDIQTTEKPQKDHEETASRPQKDTNNNDKNDKKDIYTPEPPSGRSRKTPVFDAESKPYRCAVYLANKIKERVPDKKIPAQFMQTWAHEMDKLNRIDGHKWEDIAAVLDFSQQDKFWSKQILSGGNLRKHFDRLYLNMQEDETQ